MGRSNIFITWGFHQNQLKEILQSMYNNEINCDCTLICAGGYSIECHRIVLSACSPFFKQIILEHPHEKPEITLAEITKFEMSALYEYMYTGETSISAINLERFLKICKDLQISNLTEFIVKNSTDLTSNLNCDADLLEVQDFPTLDLDSQCEIGDDIIGNCADDSFMTEEAIEIVPEESNWSLPVVKEKEIKESPTPAEDCENIANKKEEKTENFDNRTSLIIDLGSSFRRRYQCRQCGSRYSHKRTVLHHLHWICGQPATYACTLCPYRGKRKFQLRSHLEHVHFLVKHRKKKRNSSLGSSVLKK